MRTFRERLTYANVASTLALVIAIGGGGTAVAMAVANNSVGSQQIINGSIKHKDLTNGKIGIVRGYAWNDDEDTTLNEPVVLDTGYKYNSKGGPITVTRTGVGDYTITFANLNFGPGNVQVTAYDSNSNYCKIDGWFSGGAYVVCFDHAGTPANTRWQIAVIE